MRPVLSQAAILTGFENLVDLFPSKPPILAAMPLLLKSFAESGATDPRDRLFASEDLKRFCKILGRKRQGVEIMYSAAKSPMDSKSSRASWIPDWIRPMPFNVLIDAYADLREIVLRITQPQYVTLIHGEDAVLRETGFRLMPATYAVQRVSTAFPNWSVKMDLARGFSRNWIFSWAAIYHWRILVVSRKSSPRNPCLRSSLRALLDDQGLAPHRGRVRT